MLIYDGQPPVSVHLPVTWGGGGGGGFNGGSASINCTCISSHAHCLIPTLKFHCQVPCHQEGSLDAIYGLISMFQLIVSSTVPKTTDIFQNADTSKKRNFRQKVLCKFGLSLP